MALLPPQEVWNQALALAAHPDDLEFGASWAIARWKTAKKAGYVLATRDETFIGTLDAEECAIVLGNLLLTYSLELRHDLAGVIGGHWPDVLA